MAGRALCAGSDGVEKNNSFIEAMKDVFPKYSKNHRKKAVQNDSYVEKLNILNETA